MIDGLGHVRALVAPNGAITEVWHYDSWGNPISPPAQRIDQPFLWNGAYGWTYTPFIGLYHLNPDYDPRTGRYLQRKDNSPNPYIHAQNNPVSDEEEPLIDESGRAVVYKKSYLRAINQVNNQVLQPMKGTAEIAGTLNPIVQVVEASCGETVSGEKISAGERILIFATLGRGRHLSRAAEEAGGFFKRAIDAVKKLWNRLRGAPPSPPQSRVNPLRGLQYTQKVIKQMQDKSDSFHSFPLVVENYGEYAEVHKILGNDGVERTLVRLRGFYDGKEGHFEWIIEPDGKTCNHRMFVPLKK